MTRSEPLLTQPEDLGSASAKRSRSQTADPRSMIAKIQLPATATGPGTECVWRPTVTRSPAPTTETVVETARPSEIANRSQIGRASSDS
jgi:hypothetical protein